MNPVDTHTPEEFSAWLEKRAKENRSVAALPFNQWPRSPEVLKHLAFRFEQGAEIVRKMAAEIERLEALVYVPGHWRCAKCDFYMVSTSIHVPSGQFSANNQPQQCANGCGPMWRVTEREAGNKLADQLEAARDRPI
jgi:hypothetical protein